VAQVNSGFFYSSAEQRERLVRAERQVTTERVQKIIDLKRAVSGFTYACPLPDDATILKIDNCFCSIADSTRLTADSG
jgi:hypothetical protein